MFYLLAIETFVYLYIVGFIVSTGVAVALLIGAARQIAKSEKSRSKTIQTNGKGKEILRSWSDSE